MLGHAVWEEALLEFVLGYFRQSKTIKSKMVVSRYPV